MTIYCESELLDALKEIIFPKTKYEIISALEKVEDIDEAFVIALDELEDKIYNSISEICDNA